MLRKILCVCLFLMPFSAIAGLKHRVALEDLSVLSDADLQILSTAEHDLALAHIRLAGAKMAKEQAAKEVDAAKLALKAVKAEKKAAEAEKKAAQGTADDGRSDEAQQILQQNEDRLKEAEARVAWAEQEKDAIGQVINEAEATLRLREAFLELASAELLSLKGAAAAKNYDPKNFKAQVEKYEQELSKASKKTAEARESAAQKKAAWMQLQGS